jgi:hypothetical protein
MKRKEKLEMLNKAIDGNDLLVILNALMIMKYKK